MLNTISDLATLHERLHKSVQQMVRCVTTRLSQDGTLSMASVMVGHDQLEGIIAYEDYLQYADFLSNMLADRPEVLDVEFDYPSFCITLDPAWCNSAREIIPYEKDQSGEEAGTYEFYLVENDLVSFERNGKHYSFTRDELEAAYRKQQANYREEDALCHLNMLVFGCADSPEEYLPLEEIEMAKNSFFGKYRVSYARAKGTMLPAFAREFDASFDANQDENSAWDNAIRSVLYNVEKHG